MWQIKKLGELLYGILAWLVFEAGVSAYLGVWFNVGVDVGVLALFSFPLVKVLQSYKEENL